MDPLDWGWNRNLLTAGVRSVLVIRVVAKDAATAATEAQLSSQIFGGTGFNLKSGFARCSYNQLLFEPQANTIAGPDGIHTTFLPNVTVNGVSDATVRNAVLAQATAELGAHPRLLADHVMLCLPPGTAGGWIAYAYANSWMSAYNDKWCSYVSAQIHELGKFPGLSYLDTKGCTRENCIFITDITRE